MSLNSEIMFENRWFLTDNTPCLITDRSKLKLVGQAFQPDPLD